MTWVQAPPDEVAVDEPFTVVFELLLDDDEFWLWAVDEADYNVFADISTTSIT